MYEIIGEQVAIYNDEAPKYEVVRALNNQQVVALYNKVLQMVDSERLRQLNTRMSDAGKGSGYFQTEPIPELRIETGSRPPISKIESYQKLCASDPNLYIYRMDTGELALKCDTVEHKEYLKYWLHGLHQCEIPILLDHEDPTVLLIDFSIGRPSATNSASGGVYVTELQSGRPQSLALGFASQETRKRFLEITGLHELYQEREVDGKKYSRLWDGDRRVAGIPNQEKQKNTGAIFWDPEYLPFDDTTKKIGLYSPALVMRDIEKELHTILGLQGNSAVQCYLKDNRYVISIVLEDNQSDTFQEINPSELKSVLDHSLSFNPAVIEGNRVSKYIEFDKKDDFLQGVQYYVDQVTCVTDDIEIRTKFKSFIKHVKAGNYYEVLEDLDHEPSLIQLRNKHGLSAREIVDKEQYPDLATLLEPSKKHQSMPHEVQFAKRTSWVGSCCCDDKIMGRFSTHQL